MTDLSRFSRSQLERFQRHFSLAGFGPEAQERLLDARVLVIGAGGLGAPLLTYLAAGGVGAIDLVDHDVVDRSNLHRQVIHSDADVGRLKTESAAETMRGLHPEARLTEFREPITPQNALALVEPVDLVIDGSDNFATRYVVSDACEIAGKPLVSGSILRFHGQVSLFWSRPDPDRPGFEGWAADPDDPAAGAVPGPTYRDLYPEAPGPGEVPTCAEAGVLGVLPGVIGSLMATEAIKFLAGIGEPLLGRVLNYDALAAGFREIRLQPDPHREPVTRIGADVSGLGGGAAAGLGSGSAEVCETPATPAERSDASTADSAPSEERVEAGELDFNPFTGEPKQTDDLSPAEFRAALADGRLAGVVDVREPWEHQVEAVGGAVNIPLMDLWHSEAPPPGLEEATEERPVVFYCAHGVRSRQALQLLRRRHPEAPVRNLMGGYELYKSS